MKKNLLFIIGVCVCLGTIYIQGKSILKLKDQLSIQTENVSTLMEEVTHYKTKDSANVAEIKALRLSKSQLEKLRKKDVELIKELKLRPKDVQYISKISTITKDSIVYIPTPDSSCFQYQDKWLKVDICPKDSSVVIQNTDSISQFISTEYRHKFLWWRWGLKGFKQTVINHNPHSRIKYAEFISVSK